MTGGAVVVVAVVATALVAVDWLELVDVAVVDVEDDPLLSEAQATLTDPAMSPARKRRRSTLAG